MALGESANKINHARNSNSTPLVARLSKCPRSLHVACSLERREVGGKGQKPVRVKINRLSVMTLSKKKKNTREASKKQGRACIEEKKQLLLKKSSQK